MVWRLRVHCLVLFHAITILLLPIFQPTFALSLSPNLPPLLPTNPRQQQSADGEKGDSSNGSSRYHTSDFGARQNHPTSYDPSPPFLGPLRLLKGQDNINHSDGSTTNSRNTFDTGRERIQHYFQRRNITLSAKSTSNTLLKESSPTKHKLKEIVNHLAWHNAPVDVKEVCESVEFVLRTRKRLLGAAKKQKQRASSTSAKNDVVHLYDLCCGHGLTGLLFACCGMTGGANGKSKLHVILVDQKQPPSHAILSGLLGQVCPWILIEDVVAFREASLDSLRSDLASDSANNSLIIISTHACGGLTDRVLDLATNNSAAAAVAVMPCCYTGTSQGTPYGVQRALGVAWAADIQRSFQLQARGYHSDFATIPKEITPMNRILLGELRGGKGKGGSSEEQ